ncbi:MAG: beta-N-acetylglucosaminidase domain-containing protein [Succinivibrionaceae bacterium]
MSSNATAFPKGVIEGFFGTPWNKLDRLSFISWLPNYGYNFFIYAPKNDKSLRKLWFNKFDKNWLNYISNLSKTCNDNNLSFGIGLSPMGATTDLNYYLSIIERKVLELLDNVSIQYLSILFDDLKIDNHKEGYNQNIVLHTILNIIEQKNLKLEKILTCPSYYSTDPILEKVFGKMPNNYYEDFLKNLPKNVDVFWTGEKVMSTSYSKEHLTAVNNILGRKPFIWDNYPVNDGKKSSEYLNLESFLDRKNVISHSCGIAINPMKQIFLNKIPLATLNKALGEPHIINNESSISNHLCKAIDLYINEVKLKAIPCCEIPNNIKNLIQTELSYIQSNPMAKEFSDFLNGVYTFDPECLTG